MMIENFEQRFEELDSDKAKDENLLFINLFAVGPGKMDFGVQELIDLQNSAALKACSEKLSVMATGQDLVDFWKPYQSQPFQSYGHSVQNSSLALEQLIGANELSLQ